TDAEGRTALYSAQYFGEKSYSAEEKKRFKEIENYLKKQGAREHTGLRLRKKYLNRPCRPWLFIFNFCN
ncbi:MAG: hypothetical protein OEZ34_14490, partial [Spirochaetia bacterium]|nr:hypothetical protein [Spirochaetia bacterium]